MKHRAMICTALCCTLAGTALGFAAANSGMPAIADLFGDINADGEINAGDAADLLIFCAYQGAGGDSDLKTWLDASKTPAVTETTELPTETTALSTEVLPTESTAAPPLPTQASEAYLDAVSIEVRPVLNEDGTTGSSYQLYIVCSGNYDYCWISNETHYEIDSPISYSHFKMEGNEWELAPSSVSKVVCSVTPYKDGLPGETQTCTWTKPEEPTKPAEGGVITSGKVEARTVLIDYDNDGTLEVADGYDYYLVCEGNYSYCDVECTSYDADPDDGYTQTLKMKENELKLTAGSSISKVVASVTPYLNGIAGEPQTYTWSADDPFTGSVTSCKIESRAVYVDYDGDGVKERADGDDYYIVAEGDYDFCSLEFKGYDYADDEGSDAAYMELIGSEKKLCAGSSIYKLVCEVTPVKNGIAGETFTVIWTNPNF